MRYLLINKSSEILAPANDSKVISVDLETSGLRPEKDTIHGVAFSLDGKIGYYTTNIELCRKVLMDKTWTKVFHNAVFDMSFLKKAGFVVAGGIFDTMVMAHLLDVGVCPPGYVENTKKKKSLSLKKLSLKFLGEKSLSAYTKMQEWLKQNNMSNEDIIRAPEPVLTAYAGEDAVNTYNLFVHFCGLLHECDTWMKDKGFKKSPLDLYLEEEQKMIPVLVDMKTVGIKLDIGKLAERRAQLQMEMEQIYKNFPKDKYIQKCEDILNKRALEKKKQAGKQGKLQRIAARIKKESDAEVIEALNKKYLEVEAAEYEPKNAPPKIEFNWVSPDHLKLLLYKVLGERVKKTTEKGSPSVDEEVLTELVEKYSWIKDLLEYRSKSKLCDTYLKEFQEQQYGGNIYCNFNITGTATGRFSSSDPNLQNLPKSGNIKELFIPRPGYKFVYGDYSQLELRIAAHLSEDRVMVGEYRKELEGGSPDLHRQTAQVVFDVPYEEVTDEQRSHAKNINFAIIYNAGGYRIAEMLGYLKDLDRKDWDLIKPQVTKGDQIIKRLFQKYRGLKRFIDKTQKELYNLNFTYTEFGRIRRLMGLQHEEKRVAKHWLKSGFNLPIQGFGASITKRAMIEAHQAGYQLVSQIHDALVFEVPNDKNLENSVEEIRHIMENVVELKVPLKVEPKILDSLEEK